MSDLQRHYKTEAGFFAYMTYQTMLKAGLDVTAIFSRFGQFEPFVSPDFRSNGHIHKYFWQAAENSSADTLIGLHVGEKMPILRGHIMEYIFLSSPCLGEALQKAGAYTALISDLIAFQLKVGVQAEIVCQLQLDNRHFAEFALAQVIAFLGHVTQGSFKPLQIRLPYARTADLQEYQRVFGCPVQFDCADMTIQFDAGLLAWQSPSAQPHLLAAHEIVAERFLAELEKHDLVFRINHELDQLLPQDLPDREAMCERLNKNPHTLKAELAGIGTSFSDIVDSYQKNLACRLLRQHDEPIEQIAYLTGFSELSAFSRAFKRWMGKTPKQYRQQWH